PGGAGTRAPAGPRRSRRGPVRTACSHARGVACVSPGRATAMATVPAAVALAGTDTGSPGRGPGMEVAPGSPVDARRRHVSGTPPRGRTRTVVRKAETAMPVTLDLRSLGLA